jgi:predicted metal-dependent hydrolase
MPDDSPSSSRLADGAGIRIGDHHVRVRISSRQRMALSVDRDASVVVHLPTVHDRAAAERFLTANLDWIARKQRDRGQLATLQPVKQLLDGEGFLVLGRNRMLRFTDGDPVKPSPTLGSAFIELPRRHASDPAAAKTALKMLYRAVGAEWLADAPRPWADRLGVLEPPIVIRDAGRRWGSYQPDSGRVILHWAAFQLPDHLLSYVVAHELTHVLVRSHDQDFWTTLKRVLPDCSELRHELDQFGRLVWTGALETAFVPREERPVTAPTATDEARRAAGSKSNTPT